MRIREIALLTTVFALSGCAGVSSPPELRPNDIGVDLKYVSWSAAAVKDAQYFYDTKQEHVCAHAVKIRYEPDRINKAQLPGAKAWRTMWEIAGLYPVDSPYESGDCDGFQGHLIIQYREPYLKSADLHNELVNKEPKLSFVGLITGIGYSLVGNKLPIGTVVVKVYKEPR
jgi:hypothetical protein